MSGKIEYKVIYRVYNVDRTFNLKGFHGYVDLKDEHLLEEKNLQAYFAEIEEVYYTRIDIREVKVIEVTRG